MMRTAACCLLLMVILSPALSAENAGPGLCGQPAPVVVLKTLDGSDFYLRDYCGQPRGPRQRQERNLVVLSFFTSWCKNCKNEIPLLQELASELSSQGAKFYLVNVGQPRDTVENYVFNNVITLPVLMDQYEVVSKKYQVKELPTLVMIDREGIIKEYHTGFVPAYGDSLRQQLRSLLGMAPVEKVEPAPSRTNVAKADSTKEPAKAVVAKKKNKK